MTELSPGLWKIGVGAGENEDGRRQRVYRTVKGTRSAASRALAALVSEVGDGSKTPNTASRELTVNELVEWYLDFARDERGLEHSTLVGYREVYDNRLRDHIGHMKAVKLDSAWTALGRHQLFIQRPHTGVRWVGGSGIPHAESHDNA